MKLVGWKPQVQYQGATQIDAELLKDKHEKSFRIDGDFAVINITVE